jgi:hypothetical protein
MFGVVERTLWDGLGMCGCGERVRVILRACDWLVGVRRRGVAAGVVFAGVWFVVGLLVPGGALAVFTRPVLREVATAGAAGLAPGGLAVDDGDDLWVEDSQDSLVGFAPAYAPGDNAFVERLSGIEGADRLEALAVEDDSEDFYVTGETRGFGPGGVEVYDRAGARLREWEAGRFRHSTLAVDNASEGSEDPSACGSLPLSPGECFVYVTERGEAGGVRKFDPEGTEEAFSYDEECDDVKCGYVSGGKITGIPGHPIGVFGVEGLVGVAVDGQGDIFAANKQGSVVYEYSAGGRFVGEFGLEGAPRLEGQVGAVTGVAVDPVSGHLLVSVAVEASGAKVGAVYEFKIETGEYVARVTEAAGGGVLEQPVGMAVDSVGDVYVVDRARGSGGVVEVYGPGAFLPTLVLGSVGERVEGGAVLRGSVNPEGFALSECEFEYVSEEAFQSEGFDKAETAECEPGPGGIPVDDLPHAVQARLVGKLTAGVSYRYRLVAHSEGELGGSAQSTVLAFTEPGAPTVSASAGGVSSTFAELDAGIDPHGAPTFYHFEYLTAAAFAAGGGSFAGAVSVPVPDASVGSGGASGGSVESVAVHVGGLVPGSEYVFRVVAENECEPGRECVGDGVSETFTTLPEAQPGLPDGRAYELVTPAVKEGGSDMFAEEETNGEYSNVQSDGTPSLSGGAFLLGTRSGFGAFPGNGFSYYVLRREASEGRWGFTSLTSPVLGVQTIQGETGVLSDPGFSRVAFTDTVGSELGAEGTHYTDLAGPPGAASLCAGTPSLEDALAGGCYVDLHDDPSFHPGQKGIETQIVGASHDLSHLLVESEDNATCGGEAAAKVTTGNLLCEWTGGYETLEDGESRPQLALVSLAPGSSTKPVSSCGAQLGNTLTIISSFAHGAVSADGSRVFFSAPQAYGANGGLLSGTGCWGGGTTRAPQLYMRAGGETVEISTPEAGVSDPTGQHAAEFAGASEDGAKVFFLTETELTGQAEEQGLHDLELYEYDSETSTLKRISGGETGEAAGGVYAVTAISADGSAVYFLANGVLAANEGANASHATPGECSKGLGGGEEGFSCNLYRYDTITGATSYIATVNDRAFTTKQGETRVPYSGADWYASPDGRFLLFKSNRPLTAFSNAGSSCPIEYEGGENSGPCAELYRYDAQASAGARAVVCVSCGGGLPTGNARFARSASIGHADGPVTPMSADGDFVFFDDPSRLVAQAENDTLDVYEWQAQGTGGCTLSEGCIRLISSPDGAFPSFFLGYSPYYLPDGERVEGGNVFFGTHAQLVPQDTNSVGNIYDARICLAQSPCIQPPASEPVQCEGSACQTPPTPPAERAPASMTLSGAGNLASPPVAAPKPKPKPKELSRAQKRAKALRVCRRRDKGHRRRRVVCERRARRKYGTSKKVRKGARSRRGGGR